MTKKRKKKQALKSYIICITGGVNYRQTDELICVYAFWAQREQIVSCYLNSMYSSPNSGAPEGLYLHRWSITLPLLIFPAYNQILFSSNVILFYIISARERIFLTVPIM